MIPSLQRLSTHTIHTLAMEAVQQVGRPEDAKSLVLEQVPRHRQTRPAFDGLGDFTTEDSCNLISRRSSASPRRSW